MVEKIIIPQKDTSIIAELENGVIKETGRIDVPYSSKSVFLKNRLIVSLIISLRTESNMLKIFDEFGNQLLKMECNFTSINFKDNTVYLGGQYKSEGGEQFSFIDLTNINFNMKKVELPIDSIKGKSIDDILIRNNVLFLVDNIVFPKYIIKYDISITSNPKHIGTYILGNNGTYEHIIKGDINENWVMLFSETVGELGSSQHISIIGKEENWGKSNVLTLGIRRWFDGGDNDDDW